MNNLPAGLGVGAIFNQLRRQQRLYSNYRAGKEFLAGASLQNVFADRARVARTRFPGCILDQQLIIMMMAAAAKRRNILIIRRRGRKDPRLALQKWTRFLRRACGRQTRLSPTNERFASKLNWVRGLRSFTSPEAACRLLANRISADPSRTRKGARWPAGHARPLLLFKKLFQQKRKPDFVFCASYKSSAELLSLSLLVNLQLVSLR